VVLVVRGRTASSAAPCGGADERVAVVWTPERSARIHAAFLATHLPYAESSYQAIDRMITAYTRRWADMHTDACRATHVRGEQSTAVLDLRMRCLDRRLGELSAAVQLLASADAAVVQNAASVASGVDPVDGCADVDALQAPVELPADPLVRARIEATHREVDRAAALEQAGRYRDAVAVAAAAEAQARELGWPPLLAQALGRHGSLQRALSDPATEDTLLAAVAEAGAARVDRVAAEADIDLAMLLISRSQLPEALRVTRIAEGMVARAADPQLWIRLRAIRGRVLEEQGRLADARHQLEVALATGAGDAQLETEHTGAMRQLGSVLTTLGEYDRAVEIYRQVIASAERTGGPDHPTVADALTGLGEVLLRQGKVEDAVAAFARALHIREGALGPDHPVVATSLANLAAVQLEAGHNQEAVAAFQRVLPILEAHYGPDHAYVASVLGNLGEALTREHRYAEARPYLERVLATRIRLLGPEHPSTATSQLNLGLMLTEAGRPQEALAHLARAEAIWRKVGVDNPMLGYALTGRGQALTKLGRPAAAIPVLEEAIVLRQRAHVSADMVAPSQFALAQALRAAGRQPTRAVELARQARDGFAGAGEAGRSQVEEIDRWLGD